MSVSERSGNSRHPEVHQAGTNEKYPEDGYAQLLPFPVPTSRLLVPSRLVKKTGSRHPAMRRASPPMRQQQSGSIVQHHNAVTHAGMRLSVLHEKGYSCTRYRTTPLLDKEESEYASLFLKKNVPG